MQNYVHARCVHLKGHAFTSALLVSESEPMRQRQE